MPSHRVWTLIMVCVTTFMLMLDITVVSVALPQIQEDLDASLEQMQWVVNGYTLALAVFLLSAATLGDRIGRVRLFAFGTALFAFGSLACGFAQTALALDLFRAVQGGGGAVLFGIGVPMIADAYPAGRARNLAIGAYGAVSGSAVAVGPLIGGALIGVADWRSIFWVNVPIGLAVLVLSRNRLVRQRTLGGRRVDWVGMCVVTVALFLLVLALITGNDNGWGSPSTVSMLVGAGVLFAGFIVVERRIKEPMIDLGLFRDPTYTASTIVGFVVQATVVASTTYLSLYAQNVLRLSPLDTGLRFLPFSLVAFFSAAAIAPVIRLVSPRWLLGGTALCAAMGMALLSRLQASSDWTALVPGFVVCGLGLGMAATVLNQVSVASVGEERSGMASGVSVSFRQIGVAVGVAGLGVIYQRVITARAVEAFAGTPLEGSPVAREAADAVAAGGGERVADAFPDAIRPVVAQAAREATVAGLDHIMLVGAVTAFAVAVLSVIISRPSTPSSPQP